MVQNSTLRANARKQLGGGLFKKPWLMTVVVVLIYTAICSAISTGTIGFGFLLLGALEVGLCMMVLNGVRKNEWNIGGLFGGFKHFFKTLFLRLLKMVYLFLWSMLFCFPALIKWYSYSMAYYIHIDNPELGINDCITISRKMMDGHKWQLFCLDLSFIGWYILGFLCLGLGVPFVEAYKKTAYANFYLARKAEVSVR